MIVENFIIKFHKQQTKQSFLSILLMYSMASTNLQKFIKFQ